MALPGLGFDEDEGDLVFSVAVAVSSTTSGDD
jgi:hypothetical protein